MSEPDVHDTYKLSLEQQWGALAEWPAFQSTKLNN